MSGSTPSSDFVADTIAVVLRLEHRRLGDQARVAFELAEQGSSQILVPAMVFAEIGYLSERGRIQTSLAQVRDYMARHRNVIEQPMTLSVVMSAMEIKDIPELHDRLIAGAARLLDTALITNDHVIQASKFVRTVW
jgi:PIN domain nuclease of toxin-antitoxin system